MLFITKHLFVVIAIMCGTVSGLDWDSAKNSVSQGINSVIDVVDSNICMVNHRDKFDKCNDLLNDFNQLDSSKDVDIKEFCCAFISYRECLENVAQLYCGQTASQTVEIFVGSVKGAVLPKDCEQYNKLWDCVQSYLLFVVVLVGALMVIGLLFGIGCCIKSICC